MSSVAAGWYSSPENPNQNRYWDGVQWTHHVAPAAPQPSPSVAPTTPPPAAYPAPSAYSPPPGPTFPPPAPNVSPAATASSPQKKWLIGGAIVAGVIVVSSVNAAIGGANRDDEPFVQASTAPVVVEETEESVEPTPTPAPAAEEVVDAVAFRAQANSHLDDMLKDLGDMVITVQEDGFWRLLSNSGELAFNLGQLEALDVPSNVATTWPESTSALDTTLDTLSDAVSTQDGPTILAAIEVVRTQVEASREVVTTAQ